MQLKPEELLQLKQAFGFYDQGFTLWNQEKDLFVKAARAYLEEHTFGDATNEGKTET